MICYADDTLVLAGDDWGGAASAHIVTARVVSDTGLGTGHVSPKNKMHVFP